MLAGLEGVGRVVVVAPATEQSGKGASLTFHHPLHIEKVDHLGVEGYSVTGTPADCVKMALSVLLKKRPDLVLSGINRGSNAGRNALYSGTVGGAIEGALRALPAIAVSCHDYEKPEFHLAEKHVSDLVEYAMKHPLPQGTVLNVNVPNRKSKGLRMARQGRGYFLETPDKREHPHGRHYWWLGGKTANFDEHEESDIRLLDEGWTTAVPLYVEELTHHDELDGRRDHFRDFFRAASNSSKRSRPSS